MSLFKKIFSSKGPTTESSSDDGQKKKKLLRRIALAQNDPEPLLDLSDSDLTKVDDQILTTIKVYHKHRVHLERNHLAAFSIPVSNRAWIDVTVLHLEDNQLCSLQIDTFSSLASLKELYLGNNLLTSASLPPSLFALPRLRVLSLRANRLSELPLSIFRLSSLVYCDLGYNRLSTLPASMLSAVSVEQCSPLQTLLLEGNPLCEPTLDFLATACRDATCAAQIDTALRQYYQVEADEKKEPQLKNTDVDFKVSCTKATNMTNATPPKTDLDSDTDEYNDDANDIFRKYSQKKIANKQNAIEWERAYMNSQLENSSQESKLKQNGSKSKSKDKLLHELYNEKDEKLFEKINQFHNRKDGERQRLLDQCIVQLQEHSSLLIERLSRDKTILAPPNNHEDLGSELNADITQLLAQYDAKLNLKRNMLLNHIVESEQEGQDKLAMSVQRKDDKHQTWFKELERQDESLSLAFDTILSARDRRNEGLTEKILLVEQELIALTFVERERRESKSDELLADLVAQRTKLAQLLGSLLEVKRSREKQLKETLEKELQKRFSSTENSNDSWLLEFQRLLSKESFERQIAQYGIDARIADILIAMYYELGDDQVHRNGTMLQAKLVYYLGHFVDIPIEQLKNCQTADELLKLNIDDYELCQLIVDRLRQYSKLFEAQPEIPTAPIQAKAVELPPIEPSSSQEVESKEDSTENKFWCEAECVICLDNTSSIVFLPCGHICTCDRCIRPNACPLSLCPLCRAEIDLMQPITTKQC